MSLLLSCAPNIATKTVWIVQAPSFWPVQAPVGNYWEMRSRPSSPPSVRPFLRALGNTVSALVCGVACGPADGSGNSNAAGGAHVEPSGGTTAVGTSSGGASGSAIVYGGSLNDGGVSSDRGGTASSSGGTSAAGGSRTDSAGGGDATKSGSGGISANGGTNAAAGAANASGGALVSGAGGTGGADAGAVPPVPLDPSLLTRCTGSNPIQCTIPVPANGNYNVTVELGSDHAASTSRVQAELYRIVVPPLMLPAGAHSQQTFSVNVRTEHHDGYDAPGMELNILIDGAVPALHGLGYASASMPTLFVVGDSTVCDWDPAAANLGPEERGWAQEFSQFLKPGLAVANYADSGDTASSLYGKFASRGAVLKAGDYLFIQFGHNDQKSQSGIDDYKANLMKYITDARAKNATPILFSPVARKAATLADPGFAGLDQQARELAQSAKVAFVDLTALSINYYATLPDKSVLFATATEGTHFSIAGATAVSSLVAKALKAGTTPSTSIGEYLR